MRSNNVQCYGFLHDLLKESTSLLNNYLSLGQFEHARSYALILKDKYPSYFVEFVNNIIQDDVPKEWVFSKSVPTASHLIWLLYTEYKGIQNIKSIDSNQLIKSEIDILLYTFSSIGVINASSHKELLEIYRLLNLDVDITNIDISDETKTNLKSSLKTDPILASSLIFYFRKTDSPAHFKMHIIRQILDILVEVINESVDQTNFDLAFKLLKHLHADQQSLPNTSHELFKKIINLYFPYDTHNIRRMVYSSLLSLHHEHNYALTCFSSIEKEIYYTDSTSSNATLPFPFHAFKIPTLNQSDSLSMFWNQYYNFITSSNQHFLEYIIIRFFELINDNNFEDIRSLLAPFERLKPLLLLMAWNKNGNDIIYREKLIDVLWSNDETQRKNLNSDLLNKSNELSNKIDLALWCGEHFVEYSNEISSLVGGAMTIFKGESDEYKISNSIYEIVDVYSIPYIIHPFFHKISSQDICNLLHKVGKKDNDSFEDDLTLTDSYFCLKYIIQLLEKCRHREANQEIIKEYIDKSSEHLKLIKSFEAKVFLIECIFSLLFMQEKAWNKDINPSIDKEKFIVTPIVAIKLLNYLKVSIETIVISNDQRIDDSIINTKSKIDEFVWRTNLIINHVYFQSENDDNIMSILLATPKTLLIRSIKEQDFATSNDIIQFFKLNDNVSDIARIAELVEKIHKKLSKNKTFDIEELDPSLSKLQEFTILSDILISSINLKSKEYAICLKKVKSLLEEINESIDDHLLERFHNFVNRIELLMSDTDNNYGTYLAYSYTQSFENEELLKYLKLMNSLREAVETLNIIMYSSSSESFNSEQLLKRVTLSLGEEVLGSNHDNQYLLTFLKQLLLIGMTLRDDQFIGNDNFFDLLRTSPTYLISDLVFKSGNFKKAEELSKELDKHLESVILVSINSSKLKKRSEDDLITNQVDKKSFNQKSKGMRRSTSLYSSLTNQSDYIIPGLPDDTRKYNLNMDIVEYLKKSSPIISILACILCSPSDHFDPRFLKYALSSSQKHYFPLFNWARIKARRFSLYYNTFLKENYDSLDFAIDKPLNFENDEYELSRSNSYHKSNRLNMSSSVLGSSYYTSLGTPTASMGALGIGDEENNPLAKLKLHGSPESLNFDINSTPHDTGSIDISMTPQITKSESKYTVDISHFDLDNIDFINDKDIQMDIESIFQSDYVEDEIEIYTKIVEKLVSSGNIDKALDLADRMLPNGASDQLLRLIIKQNEGNESIWRIVMRLHDKAMASHLTLEYYTRWSPDIVLEVSEMCQYHLKLKNNEALLNKIVDIHQKISLYKNILTIIPNRWRTWQELDSSCSENLVNVVNILLSSKQYDISNSLAKIFGDTKLKRKIEEEYIFYLLTELHDTNTVKRLFIEMGDDDDIQMAESLLEVINTNKDRLFLIQYLMDKKKSTHNNVYIHTLTTKELGVKILLCLSPELQKVYQHLINRPTSIIESLLMSEQTSVLAKIFEEVPQVRNDELVIKYANKALSTSNITSENETSTNIKGSTKFYIADELKEHTYSSAPSYTLASNILDLCYNNQLAAHTCLTICDNLSLKLIGLKDRLDIVKIMHQLIYYAKVRLTKDGTDENPNLLQLCDTLLGKTELLLQLIFSATPDIAKNLSLSSFADTQKVRILRDKLIEQDMLELALLVANKCGIEAEPIWAAKGLQLLQVAMYQEAKQLFKLCMVSPHDDEDQHYRVNNLSGPKTPEDNVPLLNKIITVLESDVPLDTKNMSKKYNELNALKNNPALLKRFKAMDDANDEEDAIKAIESISKNKNQGDIHFKPKRKHTLDSNRYMQCVFYLQRYGTDELLLKFWLRHNLIEDALRHLTNKEVIDHKLFLSIIYHSTSHNLFQRFKEAITKIDPALKKWREPLLNVCKELNAKKMYKLLIEFQVLMKDYSRAGLTCIKIFSQHEDYSIRMHYLNAAQKYFSASLELESQVDNPISKSDVNKYIKTARLQAKVTNFFHENSKEIIEPLPYEFSLFLPLEVKSKIAESIIVNHNFDLAFQIIQEYRLPASDIYHNAIKKIAIAKQTRKIEELIKNIKPFSSDVDIDHCILTVITIYIEEFNDLVGAKELFPRMKTDALKCEALIQFRQLKEAYILAAKINDMRLVTMIRDVAQKYEMKREYELCEKFLSSRPQL